MLVQMNALYAPPCVADVGVAVVECMMCDADTSVIISELLEDTVELLLTENESGEPTMTLMFLELSFYNGRIYFFYYIFLNKK